MPRAASVPSGPGGDEVHAHAARTEVAREVARGRLERGLGDAHPVVDRPGDRARRSRARRSPRPPPDSRSASADGERLERERARLERGDRALRRRVEEVAAERVLGREGDRVQDAVDAAPALAQVVGDGLEVLGLVDVELEHVGRLAAAASRRARSCAWRGRSRSARPRRRPPGPGAATSHAIESRVMTPVIRSFLPRSRRHHSCDRLAHPRCSAGRGHGRRASRRASSRAARRGVERGDDLVDVALRRGGAGAEVLVRVVARRTRSRAASGSSAAAMSRRLTIPTACLAPMTPSSRLRPGEHVVGAEVARVHGDERAAERLAQHDGDLRHRRLGERVHELGAVADHAALLLRVPGMKPGVSTSTTQRQPERVAGAHEARALGAPTRRRARRRGSCGWLAITPTGAAVEAGEAADDVARPARRATRAAGRRRRCRAIDVAHVVDAGARSSGTGVAGVVAGRARPSASAARARRCWRAGGRAGRARAAPRRRRRSATKCATPLRSWTLWPPSSAALTSSPMTSRTTAGPVRNIVARSVMTTKSVSAGE